MSLNYYTFVHRLSDLSNTIKTDFNPTLMVPPCIDYAEQRIYRELDLLGTIVVDFSATASSGVRTFSYPSSFVVVEEVNVITPSSLGSSQGGTRSPCIPATRDFINAAFPTTLSSLCGTPEYYAVRTSTSLIFGPCPDLPYQVEVTGTQRPTTLSSGNSSTILTQYVPDLFLSAAMVYLCAYSKDKAITTQQSGDLATSTQYWESQYQVLMKSAVTEQFRAKFSGDAWTSKLPSPVAQPPRR